jgi:hypothetical protein
MQMTIGEYFRKAPSPWHLHSRRLAAVAAIATIIWLFERDLGNATVWGVVTVVFGALGTWGGSRTNKYLHVAMFGCLALALVYVALP